MLSFFSLRALGSLNSRLHKVPPLLTSADSMTEVAMLLPPCAVLDWMAVPNPLCLEDKGVRSLVSTCSRAISSRKALLSFSLVPCVRDSGSTCVQMW